MKLVSRYCTLGWNQAFTASKCRPRIPVLVIYIVAVKVPYSFCFSIKLMWFEWIDQFNFRYNYTYLLALSYNQPKLCPNSSWNPNATTFANFSTLGSQPFGIFVNTNNTIYATDYQQHLMQGGTNWFCDFYDFGWFQMISGDFRWFRWFRVISRFEISLFPLGKNRQTMEKNDLFIINMKNVFNHVNKICIECMKTSLKTHQPCMQS